MSKPDDKLSMIESLKPEMLGLQQYLTSKDKEMKKTTSRVNKAMRETVDLSDLDSKIFGKYSKFISSKAANPPAIVPRTNKKGTAKTKDKDNAAGSSAVTTPPIQTPEQETDMRQDDLGSRIDPQERTQVKSPKKPIKNPPQNQTA